MDKELRRLKIICELLKDIRGIEAEHEGAKDCLEFALLEYHELLQESRTIPCR